MAKYLIVIFFLFPLLHSINDFHEKTTDAGGATYENSRFDMMTFRDHNISYLEDDDGNKKSFVCNERYYIPPEITWLLKTLGFNKIGIFGARLAVLVCLTTGLMQLPENGIKY